MKLNNSVDWLRKRAGLERDIPVAAGERALHVVAPVRQDTPTAAELGAFGSLIELLRRKKSLTLDELAARARVDEADLTASIFDSSHTPEPLTVVRVADYFDLPRKKVKELAGMTRPGGLTSVGGVKFAARSDSLDDLTPEEESVLKEIVKFLTKD